MSGHGEAVKKIRLRNNIHLCCSPPQTKRGGFTLIEVLVGGLILATAGVALARALASVAATDAAAAGVLAESQKVRDELNRVALDLALNLTEQRPAYFNLDQTLIDSPGWTLQTRCQATERDPERLWEVQTTIEGGRWGAPTTLWCYRPPPTAEGAP